MCALSVKSIGALPSCFSSLRRHFSRRWWREHSAWWSQRHCWDISHQFPSHICLGRICCNWYLHFDCISFPTSPQFVDMPSNVEAGAVRPRHAKRPQWVSTADSLVAVKWWETSMKAHGLYARESLIGFKPSVDIEWYRNQNLAVFKCSCHFLKTHEFFNTTTNKMSTVIYTARALLPKRTSAACADWHVCRFVFICI